MTEKLKKRMQDLHKENNELRSKLNLPTETSDQSTAS